MDGGGRDRDPERRSAAPSAVTDACAAERDGSREGLGPLLAAASTSNTVGHGGVLLAFYSAGLAVPFLLTALAFDRATNAFRWIRTRYMLVTAASGAILIFMGVLMLTGELTRLNIQAQALLHDLGLDFLYRL